MEDAMAWTILPLIFCVLILILLFIKIYNVVTMGKFESKKRLDGKVIIVTGSNRGIGKYTALDFANRGARVIMACRDIAKANETKEEIVKISGNENIVVRSLDLSSLTSVRNFAQDVISTEIRLDVLVNNAGVWTTRSKKTEDGIDEGLQVNHYGHFLLTNLLLGLLKKSTPSRIVNLTSLLHMFGQMDFDNMNCEKGMHKWMIYDTSKLYNFIGSNEFARRLQGTGVTSNAVHPGAVRTEIFNNEMFLVKFILNTFFQIFCKNTEEGAQTTIYLSVSDDVSNVSGKYFADCKQSIITRPIGNNKEIGEKFFEKCCKIVGLKPEERLI